MDETTYVLGTEHAELHRLGLQHQVWSAEARRGWELGGFRSGHTLLDLGCGPGFCTLELAYLVGAQGKVIGVDFAASYIDFLRKQSELHGLSIDAQHSPFEDMQLEPQSLDGVFCRWALAWVSDPQAVLAKVKAAFANERIDACDGVRIDLADGWVHLRASNTEPIIRLISEAESDAQANALADRVARAAGIA